VAVLADGKPPLERTFTREMEHGRCLAPALHDLLSTLDGDRCPIDTVSVDVGPGSYTGLRIGIATAQMLAFAYDVPLVGVCSLDAIARAVRCEWDSVCAIMDAKWGKVYARFYVPQSGVWQPVGAPFVAAAGEALEKVTPRTLVVGEGLEAHADLVRSKTRHIAPRETWFPQALNVARLAQEQAIKGPVKSALELEPLYLTQRGKGV